VRKRERSFALVSTEGGKDPWIWRGVKKEFQKRVSAFRLRDASVEGIKKKKKEEKLLGGL